MFDKNAWQREYRKKNLEKHRKQWRESYMRHRDKRIAYQRENYTASWDVKQDQDYRPIYDWLRTVLLGGLVREPQGYTDKQKRFWNWTIDLDKRLNEWLKDHPEPIRILPYLGNTVRKLLSSSEIKTKVEVLESLYLPGCWCVWLNAVKVNSFFGPDAQQRATKFAGELLKT